MADQEFSIIQSTRNAEENAKAFAARKVPARLRNHLEAAAEYDPTDELIDALNTAIAVGAPLLITGDPGTGKTQAAYYAARRLGLAEVFKLDVTTETVAEDLFYTFDRVAYFHDANVKRDPNLDASPHVLHGPLWKAFEAVADGRPAVVLIDEIDKAPRDFPNSLLNALDQYEFREPVKKERQACDPKHPPLVVITSNSEKRLPDPLLRRCIYHYIPFDDEHVRRVVEKRREGFPNLDTVARAQAFERFLELRKLPLRKKPATGELLVWLTVLSADAKRHVPKLKERSLRNLPALSCLLKDQEDFEALGPQRSSGA